jgi:hypothetical protein
VSISLRTEKNVSETGAPRLGRVRDFFASLISFGQFRFVSFRVDSDFCYFAPMRNNRKTHLHLVRSEMRNAHIFPFSRSKTNANCAPLVRTITVVS